jgi:hypothetical protein
VCVVYRLREIWSFGSGLQVSSFPERLLPTVAVQVLSIRLFCGTRYSALQFWFNKVLELTIFLELKYQICRVQWKSKYA